MMDQLRQQLQDRVVILKQELELGEQQLNTLERESLGLQQTLLRISGAIQVLQELSKPTSPNRPSTTANPHR